MRILLDSHVALWRLFSAVGQTIEADTEGVAELIAQHEGPPEPYVTFIHGDYTSPLDWLGCLCGQPFLHRLMESLDFAAGGGVVGPGILLFISGQKAWRPPPNEHRV